jgi:serine/threonine protein kinase
MNINTKLALLSDYLCGLSYLHDRKGVMHLDISPGNLVVTSLANPKGVIIDLDAAVKSVTSSNHMKGTLPYLAPEIMELKAGDTGQPFERSVDIWALGLCMFDLHVGKFLLWAYLPPQERAPRRNTTVSPGRYSRFQQRIEAMKKSSETSLDTRFVIFIEKMTEYKPGDRPAASMLYHTISSYVKDIDRGSINLKGPSKRPREE